MRELTDHEKKAADKRNKLLLNALLVAHYYALTGQVYEYDHAKLVGSVLVSCGSSHESERELEALLPAALDAIRRAIRA